MLFKFLHFVLLSSSSHARDPFDIDGYYAGTGVQFLKTYGKYYHIFSTFLLARNTSEKLKSDPKLVVSKGIRSSFKVRDYNNYADWESIAAVDRNIFSNDYDVRKGYYLMEKSLEYVPVERRETGYHYNNIYRYGPEKLDRFLAIVFKNDPWADSVSAVSFVGEGNGRFENVSCSYSYPISATSPYIVDNKNNYIHRCQIPAELSSTLTKNHHYIQLDLVYPGGILLKNIKVRRLHPLDRRQFTTTAYTLTSTITDNMLIEWITYNLMLGIEHFYIFDNRKLFPPLPSSNISTDAAYWQLAEDSAIEKKKRA